MIVDETLERSFILYYTDVLMRWYNPFFIFRETIENEHAKNVKAKHWYVFFLLVIFTR